MLLAISLVSFLSALGLAQEDPMRKRSVGVPLTAVWWFTPSASPSDNKTICIFDRSIVRLTEAPAVLPLYDDCRKLHEIVSKQNGIYTARNFTRSSSNLIATRSLVSHGECVLGIHPKYDEVVKPENMYDIGAADIAGVLSLAFEYEKRVHGGNEPPAGHRMGWWGFLTCASDATTSRGIRWRISSWNEAFY